jgi:hypothetical protein
MNEIRIGEKTTKLSQAWHYMKTHFRVWAAKTIIYVGTVFGILSVTVMYVEANHLKIDLNRIDKDSMELLLMCISVIIMGIIMYSRKLLEDNSKKSYVTTSHILLGFLSIFCIGGIFGIWFNFTDEIKGWMMIYIVWFAVFETKNILFMGKKILERYVTNPQDRLSIIITFATVIIAAIALFK